MLGDYFYNKGYDDSNPLHIVSMYLNDQIASEKLKVPLYKTHIDKDGIFHILKNKIIVFSIEFFYVVSFDKQVIDFIELEILNHKLKLLGD